MESHDQLNQSYKSLLNDHEQLQRLYLQLEADYDELYGEVGKRQATVAGLTHDLDELHMKYAASLDMIDGLEQGLDKALESKAGVSVGCETEERGDVVAEVENDVIIIIRDNCVRTCFS